MNVRLTLKDGKVHVSYSCPRPVIPAVKNAIGILREHKQETVALLSERTKSNLPESRNWPCASLEAEKRFGQPQARLYPFIGRQVRTPRGTGRLLQVFSDRAVVLLDGEFAKPQGEQREAYFDPCDICPPQVM